MVSSPALKSRDSLGSLGLASPHPSRRQSRGRDRTVMEIERLAKNREERRKSASEYKRKRAEEIKENERRGTPGDETFSV